ncbi:MAG: hypothetical protein IJC34_09570 [Lentisphaeria bacterium]|nr:hypothetical protein [Lentisphaeria bacterium]
MKFLSMLTLVFCGAMLTAGTDIDVNGKFIGSKEGEIAPNGWVFNPSVKPVGTGKVVKVGDKFGVQISNPKRDLHYYSKKQVDVAPGEKYELSCDVTGTGKAALAMYLYNAKGWVGGIYQVPVTLKPGENDLKFEVVIPAEFNGKVPARACFAFFVRGAAEATFSDFEAEKEDAK